MQVTVTLRDDQPELLARLKKARRTRNSNQIFREALYEYSKKILPESVPTGTKNQGECHEN